MGKGKEPEEIRTIRIAGAGSVKVTRALPYALFFDAGGRHYLLHMSEESGEAFVTLYERALSPKGAWKLTGINGTAGNIGRYMKFRCKGRVYAQFDTEALILQLTLDGFASGCMDREAALRRAQARRFRDFAKLADEARREALDAAERLECPEPRRRER